jgi:hypothetical protein
MQPCEARVPNSFSPSASVPWIARPDGRPSMRQSKNITKGIGDCHWRDV